MEKNDNLIRDGDHVVVQLNDGNKSTSIIHVTASRQQKVGRARLSVQKLIGQPYGSVFQINERKLELLSNEEIPDFETSVDAILGDVSNEDGSIKGDNSTYVDSNTAQKLCDEDIIKLKESGASGLDIIKTLISNSDTWASKNEFAREKWLKRKQKKYMPCIRVLKATPARICEVYHGKNADKICNIRWDTLAQILSLGGIRPGARVLLVESTVGLVSGAVAYRMGGFGRILSVYPGQQPHFELVSALNLPTEQTSILHPVPSPELASAASFVRSGLAADINKSLPSESKFTGGLPVSSSSSDASSSSVETTTTTLTTTFSSPSDATAHEYVNNSDNELSSTLSLQEQQTSSSSASSSSDSDSFSSGKWGDEVTFLDRNENKEIEEERDRLEKAFELEAERKKGVIGTHIYNATGRREEDKQRIRRYLREGVECLVIASKYDPFPILQQTLPLLAPSSSFVIYSEFLQPLLPCYYFLLSHELGIKLNLSDTWCREFQTLPGRVHPQMYMSTSGGFLLSGIYVGGVSKIKMPPTIHQAFEEDISEENEEEMIEVEGGGGGGRGNGGVGKRGRGNAKQREGRRERAAKR